MPVTDTAATSLYLLPREADVVLQTIVSLIDGAKSSVTVAQFQLSHPQIVAALGSAHDRGVTVKILLDHTEACTAVEVLALHLLCQHLPAQNIVIGTSPVKSRFMHAKLCVIDGRTVIGGSTNWSVPGLQEVQEFHVTESPTFAAAIEQEIATICTWIEENEPKDQLAS